MSLLPLLLALHQPTAQARSLDTFSLSGALFDDAGTLQLSHPRLGAPRAAFAGGGVG